MNSHETFITIDLLTVSLLVLRCFSYSIHYQHLMRLLIGGMVGLNSIAVPTYLVSCLPLPKRAFTGMALVLAFFGCSTGVLVNFLMIGAELSYMAWLFVLLLPIIPCLSQVYILKTHYPFDSVE